MNDNQNNSQESKEPDDNDESQQERGLNPDTVSLLLHWVAQGCAFVRMARMADVVGMKDGVSFEDVQGYSYADYLKILKEVFNGDITEEIMSEISDEDRKDIEDIIQDKIEDMGEDIEDIIPQNMIRIDKKDGVSHDDGKTLIIKSLRRWLDIMEADIRPIAK